MDDTDIEAQKYEFSGSLDHFFEELLGKDFSFGDETREIEGSQTEDQPHESIKGSYNDNIIIPSGQEKENKKLELYKAAISGEWKKAEEIFEEHSKFIKPRTKVSKLGETALHIATAADHTEFVRYLVDRMSEADLAIKAKRGNTAFCYAAVSGNTQAATFMLHKYPNLFTIRGEGDILPIRTAALHGHAKMVNHLYDHHMKHHNLADNDWLDVFMAFIDCDLYDIGRQMVTEKPWLATKANSKGWTALYAFARKSHIITSHNYSNCSGGFLSKYFSKRRNHHVLRRQGLELLKLLLQKATSVLEERSSELINRALFKAAKRGNYEFIVTAIHLYPHLAFELDENYYTIFHIAVLNRHVDIFNLVHEMDSIKNVIQLMKDNDRNNILHLAGKLPLRGLEVVPGAALQLQRELLWFEEVKKMVGPQQMEAKNVTGKTPAKLFNEEHESLRKEGEKWMKDTVNSCMVVSTLVAGVAFASAVTVPGGTPDNTGIPNSLHYIWFKIFAISDAISLLFSASSILFFLTIFTSHYSMDDFLKSLPIKFIVGLVLLSAAVQAMIVAFVAAFFIIFKHRMLQFALPIAAIASILVIFFSFLHSPLVLRVIRSTFMSFLLFRRKKKTSFLRSITSL